MRAWAWVPLGAVLFVRDTRSSEGPRSTAAAAPAPLTVVEFVPASRPLNPPTSPSQERTRPVVAASSAHVAERAEEDDADDDAADDDTGDDDVGDDNDGELALDGHVGPPNERDIAVRIGRMRGLLNKTKAPPSERAEVLRVPALARTEATPKKVPAAAPPAPGTPEDALRGVVPRAHADATKDGRSGATYAEKAMDGDLPQAATRHHPRNKFNRDSH